MSRLGHLLALARLDAIRVLRDANALLYLLMPMVGFPLLYLVMAQLYGADVAPRAYRVAVAQPELSVVVRDAGHDVVTDASLADLDAGRVDLWLEQRGSDVHVHHRASNARSRAALGEVEDLFERDRTDRLHALADTHRVQLKRVVDHVHGGPTEPLLRALGLGFGIVVPMMLSIAGPAPMLELFVLDRERHTLNSVLSTGISRLDLVLSRLLASLLIVGAAVLFGLLALSISAAVLLAQLSTPERPLEFVQLAHSTWLAIPLIALTGTALQLTLSTFVFAFPRTYRGAQYALAASVYAMFVPIGAAIAAIAADNPASMHFVPLAQTPVLLFEATTGQLDLASIAPLLLVDLGWLVLALIAWDRAFGLLTLISGLPLPSWLTDRLGSVS